MAAGTNLAPARIGIGGPVGSGKTALIERLIPSLEARGLGVGVVTNDLVTREDAERLRGSGLIAPERMIEEALAARSGKPVLTTNCATGEGIDALVERLSHDVLFDG